MGRVSPCVVALSTMVMCPAWAQTSLDPATCSVFDTLNRIEVTAARLSQYAPGHNSARLWDEFGGLLRRIDANIIIHGINAQLTETDLAVLLEFLATANTLAAVVRQPGPDSIARYLARPDRQSNTQRLLELIARSNCSTSNPSPQEAPPGNPRGLMSALRAGLSLGAMPVGLAAGLIMLALASILPIMRVTGLVSSRNQRRRKRHMCHIETILMIDGRESAAELLDISCNGAKIRLPGANPPAIRSKGNILIGGGWQQVSVRWSNSQYLGLRFRRVLNESMIEGLIMTHTQKTKTAPQGVPLATH